MRLIRLGDRREAPQIGGQCRHIFIAHAVKRRVGHHRTHYRAVRSYPKANGIDELAVGPIADAVSRVGSDIGPVKRAVRGLERSPAGVHLALCRSMATTTSGEGEYVTTTNDEVRSYGLR